MSQGKLADRVAVITGGASGIGKATAELFAAEGAKVVIGDVQREAGEDVANAIGGRFVLTDVSDSKSVNNLVDTAHKQYGRLDVMFNNAGIGVASPLIATDDETYRKTIAIDL